MDDTNIRNFSFISDKFRLSKNIDENFKLKDAFIIGLFQVLSLIPGVSRSGITISAARILKFKRYDAAKISFIINTNFRSCFYLWS